MSQDSRTLKADLASLKKSSRDTVNTLVNHRFGVPRVQFANAGGGPQSAIDGNLGDHTTLTANEVELLDLYEEIEELNLAMMTMNRISKVNEDLGARPASPTNAAAAGQTNGATAAAEIQAGQMAAAATDVFGSEEPISLSKKQGPTVRYTTDMSQINIEEENLLIEELKDKINLLTHRNKLKSLVVEKYDLIVRPAHLFLLTPF